MILVCGRPGSGNKLIREHLHRSGLQAAVLHADGSVSTPWPEGVTAVIVPVRLADETRLEGRGHMHGSFQYLLKTLSKLKVPVHLIAYEEIQRTGGEALDVIIRSMGYDPSPWPDLQDKSKPHAGRVLDEGERQALHTRTT
jgi:hypothetical protein